ncbi:MAG: hypothetical protein UX89_C0001G0034 [Parcubacteria group bacterium GW2011_GWA2_47_16]|nr:MAG: hypothetical protein UX89_C0001G0034 [Parcubacteria group bacterium GW2011_GWA2_47_16]
MPIIRFTLFLIASLTGILFLIPWVIILIPFWFISIILKIVDGLKPKIAGWEDIIKFDHLLGWRAKPNTRSYMETDGVYRITTGPDGWRGNYNLSESNVVVMGDSFVFGQGTDDGDYFAGLTKVAKVKPIGAPGYGATHYLLLLRTLTTELKDKLVIWFVFTGNDYREAIRPTSYGYHFPFVFYDNETNTYKIRTDNINPQKLPFNFEKGYKTSMPELADLYYKNYLSDYAFGAFEYLVKEAKNHCEKYGAKFAIATIPLWWVLDEKTVNKIKRHCSDVEQFSSRYPDERTAEICNRHYILFRAGSDCFVRKDFLPNDFHWSRAGNQKAALVIDEMRNLLFPIKLVKIKP